MRPKNILVSQSVKTRVVVAVATNHVAARCVNDCFSAVSITQFSVVRCFLETHGVCFSWIINDAKGCPTGKKEVYYWTRKKGKGIKWNGLASKFPLVFCLSCCTSHIGDFLARRHKWARLQRLINVMCYLSARGFSTSVLTGTSHPTVIYL